MVEVIGQSEKQHKTECGNCGAILKYRKVERVRKQEFDFTGPDGFGYYITCPQCGTELKVG